MFFKRKDGVDQLERRLDALQREVRSLRDDLDYLQAKHNRLRGHVYATRGTSGPPQKVPREELLRRYRAGLPLLNGSNNADAAQSAEGTE